MSLDAVIALLLFAFLFLLPLIGDFLKRKKKNPLPRSSKDFENRYQVKLEERKSHHQHLNPPPVQPPVEIWKRPEEEHLFDLDGDSVYKETQVFDDRKHLSEAYKPGYGLESKIESRSIGSKVSTRHIESNVEDLGFESLLQERFSEDVVGFEKKSTYVRKLIQGASLKDAIVINEILRRRF